MKTKFYFKDLSQQILFSYDISDNNIKFKPSKKEILNNKENIFDIFKNNDDVNTYCIAFSEYKIHMILAMYFAGNKIYDGCSLTEDCQKGYFTYKIFKRKNIENYLTNHLGYSHELVSDMIRSNNENLPTDIFAGSNLKNIEVACNYKNYKSTSDKKIYIEKISFEYAGFSFIHNLSQKNSIKSFENNEELEDYVRYRFWGRAKLNGKPIKLQN